MTTSLAKRMRLCSQDGLSVCLEQSFFRLSRGPWQVTKAFDGMHRAVRVSRNVLIFVLAHTRSA